MAAYQIIPVAVTGFADANGVYVNREGAWLGEVDETTVQPYCDDDGDFIAAPADWQLLIVQAL